MIREELELTRHNVTPAAFLAYIRHMLKKHNIASIDGADIDLDYFAAGNDLNFDISGRCNPNAACMHERSVSKPYEMQSYVMNWDGSVFNEIIEFSFDDEKTGTGYFYLLNTCYTAEETETAAAAEKENKAAAEKRALDQVSEMINDDAETAEIIDYDNEIIIAAVDNASGNVTRGYYHGRAVYFVRYDYAAERWISVIVTPPELSAGLAASCFDHENNIQFSYERIYLPEFYPAK